MNIQHFLGLPLRLLFGMILFITIGAVASAADMAEIADSSPQREMQTVLKLGSNAAKRAVDNSMIIDRRGEFEVTVGHTGTLTVTAASLPLQPGLTTVTTGSQLPPAEIGSLLPLPPSLPTYAAPQQPSANREAVSAQQATVVTVDTTSLRDADDNSVSSVGNLINDPGPDGKISFDEALTAINNTGSGFTIKFDGASLPHGSTINFTSSLFLTAAGTIIDGDTNSDDQPDIVLNGLLGFISLGIVSPDNIIRYVVITGLSIQGANASNNKVIGSYLGTDVEGRIAQPRQVHGLTITNGASDNIVENNIIAGNTGSAGILINNGAQRNQVLGNRIGLNIDGDAVANLSGVSIQNGSHQNIIGGSDRAGMACDASCNMISGNTEFGVILTGVGTTDNKLQGNYIGPNPSATAAVPNHLSGIVIRSGATQNFIGENRQSEQCDGPCNVISGNQQAGILIALPGTNNNEVKGNYIGLDPSGGASLPNGLSGIIISAGAKQNLIGGNRASAACTGPCNVLSGNTQGGVLVDGAGTDANAVAGNFIGSNPAGSAALANGFAGVFVQNGASQNIIGGTRNSTGCDGPCNVIGGNSEAGVSLSGAGTSDNEVKGNYIGLNITGNAPLPNGLSGVIIRSRATQNIIGGDRLTAACSGPCNVISGNADNGVFIAEAGTTGNQVIGNYMGLIPTGTAVLANNLSGVEIGLGAAQNLIGGDRSPFSTTCVGPCNVISGNGQAGVLLNQAGTEDNEVKGNFVGVDSSGAAAFPNSQSGVVIQAGAAQNVIGTNSRTNTTCDGGCNVLSGNSQAGVVIVGNGSDSNEVQGNHIGVNPSGSAPIPNTLSGVGLIDGAGQNLIGGERPSTHCHGPCNVISGNSDNGVLLSGADTTDNIVQGNYIGVDVTGATPLANFFSGISILAGASKNLIGDDRSTETCTGFCNLIAGNGGHGLRLEGTGTMTNAIKGNYIGMDAVGKVALPNGIHGIVVADGASNNIIGSEREPGVCTGVCNLVRSNGLAGVAVRGETSQGNAILGNAIAENESVGIDLDDDKVTLNDEGDGDSGPNKRQNFPVLTAMTTLNDTTTVTGTLDSAPNTTFRLEFFTSDRMDPTGFGEGENFVGTVDVATDGSGQAAFSAAFPADNGPSGFVTATATDPNNNTSEFSSGCLRPKNQDFPLAYNNFRWRFTVDKVDGDGLVIKNVSIDGNTPLFLEEVSVPHVKVGNEVTINFAKNDPDITFIDGLHVVKNVDGKATDIISWDFIKAVKEGGYEGILCVHYDIVVRAATGRTCSVDPFMFIPVAQVKPSTCYRFIPLISFEWQDTSAANSHETLDKFTAYYKLDYGQAGYALTSDEDNLLLAGFLNSGLAKIETTETSFVAVQDGTKGQFDNIHSVYPVDGQRHVWIPGCRFEEFIGDGVPGGRPWDFDCTHMHWRWSANGNKAIVFGIDPMDEPSDDSKFDEADRGTPYLVPDQTILVSVVANKPNNPAEHDPNNPASLVDGDKVAVATGNCGPEVDNYYVSTGLSKGSFCLNEVTAKDGIIVWYEASVANKRANTFFRHGFFAIGPEETGSRIEPSRAAFSRTNRGMFERARAAVEAINFKATTKAMVLAHFDQVLRDDYWLNDNTPVPHHGEQIFNELSAATSLLLQAKNQTPAVADALDLVILDLLRATNRTVFIAISQRVTAYKLVSDDALGPPSAQFAAILADVLSNLTIAAGHYQAAIEQADSSSPPDTLATFLLAWQAALAGSIPDSDTDLIADEFDNCPTVANHDQADSNADGIGDACEGLASDNLIYLPIILKNQN